MKNADGYAPPRKPRREPVRISHAPAALRFMRYLEREDICEQHAATRIAGNPFGG